MQNSVTDILRPALPDPQGSDEPSAHTLCPAVPLAIDHVHLPGEVESATDSPDRTVALWVRERRDGAGVVAQISVLTQSDLQRSMRLEDVRITSVLMDPSLVAGFAGVRSTPVCRTGLRPVDPAAANLWRETVSYVKRIVLADDVSPTPLVVACAARLLAAVAQTAFPLFDAVEQQARDTPDDKPVMLRRAIEFIESHVADDISLVDIAEAIRVTPRAVQYMFRRHLDTTPLQYVRRIRLHYAHLDLLAADRRWDTVTAVAARWGFSHTGRFAVLYRQTYGQSPHATLRD